MNDAHRGTSYFKYINIGGSNPSFASLNMDLGWRRDNISCQDFNYCCKCDSNSGNMMLSICSCLRFLIHFYSPLGKF